jgi:glutamine amidotransferase
LEDIDIKIAIIDYGMGNLQSVLNASRYIGRCNPVVTDDPKIIEEADGLILPGVGAFEDAMKELKCSNLIDVLNKEVLIQNKPILGICLGMQLLFQESEENGQHEGLGWMDGTVNRFEIPPEYQIPHVGWNDLIYSNDSPLFHEISHDKNFYFVHSYHVVTSEQNVIAFSNHGKDFVAAVQKDNIYGTQFHPEKSHINGLTFFKNYFNVIREFQNA